MIRISAPYWTPTQQLPPPRKSPVGGGISINAPFRNDVDHVSTAGGGAGKSRSLSKTSSTKYSNTDI
jgi:hypothetical protein